MTLILTAICKDGICTCADTRYQLRNATGSVIENRDGNNKIYKFEDSNIPLIIFNHGINNINGKGWEIFCSDYEKSQRWKNKNFRRITDDFKSYIESDVLSELIKNKSKNGIGFVLCGKTIYDKSFRINELFWAFNFTLASWDGGLVGSGDAYKECLADYLNKNKQSNTIESWKSKNIEETKKELIRLFLIAVKEKKRLNRDNFSDDFNIECIN